jgi:hypothetical protein
MVSIVGCQRALLTLRAQLISFDGFVLSFLLSAELLLSCDIVLSLVLWTTESFLRSFGSLIFGAESELWVSSLVLSLVDLLAAEQTLFFVPHNVLFEYQC